jgi:hypothetical protein
MLKNDIDLVMDYVEHMCNEDVINALQRIKNYIAEQNLTPNNTASTPCPICQSKRVIRRYAVCEKCTHLQP